MAPVVARGRHRVKVAINAGIVRAEWEWIGFRSGATFGNLDTNIGHELIPPIADDTVGIQSFTVHRIVGNIQIRQQAGVTTVSGFGIMIGVEDVGSDQTSDDPLVPLSTDVDHMAHKGIMWQWAGVPKYDVVMTEADDQPMIIPIDIKVKRVVNKRQRLIVQMTAASTGRIRTIVNVRALIRESAGT